MAPTENVYLKDYILCSPNYVSPLEGSWWLRAALVAQTVKNPPAVWDPGLGRFPGEGNGYPLQYSCLENPMDRGAWRSQGVRHDWVTNSFSRGVQQLGGPVAGPHWQDAFSSGQHCYAQRLASVSVSKTKIFTTHSPPPFFTPIFLQWLLFAEWIRTKSGQNCIVFHILFRLTLLGQFWIQILHVWPRYYLQEFTEGTSGICQSITLLLRMTSHKAITNLSPQILRAKSGVDWFKAKSHI